LRFAGLWTPEGNSTMNIYKKPGLDMICCEISRDTLHIIRALTIHPLEKPDSPHI